MRGNHGTLPVFSSFDLFRNVVKSNGADRRTKRLRLTPHFLERGKSHPAPGPGATLDRLGSTDSNTVSLTEGEGEAMREEP